MANPLAPTTVTADSTVFDSPIMTYINVINPATLWSTVAPYVDMAIDLDVRPFVGTALYDTVIALADTDERRMRLLRAVSYYAAMRMFKENGARISDAGNTVPVGGEGTMSLNLWQYKTTSLSLVMTADRLLDIFMQQEALSSDVQGTMLFFNNVAEYQQYYNISNSLRTYRALAPFERSAYQLKLAPYVSAVVDNITGSVTDANWKALREKVQYALAWATIYVASPNITLLVDGEGVRTISNTEALIGKASTEYKLATASLVANAEKMMSVYLQDLHKFIVDNLADYPDLEATGIYDSYNDAVEVHDTGGAVGIF